MANRELLIARHVANKSLNEIEVRFEELAEERRKLQAVVASLDEYLGDSVTDVDTDIDFGPEPFLVAQERPQPAWMSARDVLAKSQVRMTVPSIHRALTDQGHVIGKDALRIAMLRRTDIFTNDGEGVYGLKVWNVPDPSQHTKEELEVGAHMTLAEIKEAHPRTVVDW